MLFSLSFCLSLSFVFFYSPILYFLLIHSIRLFKIHIGRYFKIDVTESDCIVVTGGTSGIGLCVAKHFYRLGYTVIVGYFDSKEPGFSELEKLVKKSNEKCRLYLRELDVRSSRSIDQFRKEVEIILSNDKNLYSLINNAGIGQIQPLMWTTSELSRKLIETNLLGPYNMIKSLLPHLAKRNGRIVNVASILAFLPGPNLELYGLTKRALVHLTQACNTSFDNDTFKVKCITVLPHNHIANTNIIANARKTNETAWNKLNEKDKQLYKNLYEFYLEKLTVSEKLVIKHHSQLVSQNKQKNEPFNLICTIKRFLSNLVKSAMIQPFSDSIENSGLIDCFEDAIRLPYPPQEIFACDFGISSLLFTLPFHLMNGLNLLNQKYNFNNRIY